MAGITDKVLIEKMFGGSTDMSFGRIKVSDINSKSVQEQMRAAGIDTNSKAYKKVIGNMMAASNGMGYTNIQGIKNQLKNYDKDGDYISPVNGLAGLDATWKPGKDIPAGALDGITRESIDRSLVKVNGTYGETFQRGFDARI